MKFLETKSDFQISRAKLALSKFKKEVDGCWEWTGEKNTTGYGLLHGIGAHRWSYAIFVKDFGRYSFICHHCDNRICFNPEHLYAGSAKSNAQDALKRGRLNIKPSPYKSQINQPIERILTKNIEVTKRQDGLIYVEFRTSEVGGLISESDFEKALTKNGF